ncbi:CMRF35-like molecule 9 [Camelus dromedarius]|uniref:CMRF35-like molecule 9 n=1 Tax=Camelus dromedarius TaxID=9838 RepID=A0A5N4D2X5_CAMDR|nr:CMRF35-like molecule 9 [Camelus dromedarius]
MQPLVLLFWGGLVLPGCTALVGPKEIRGFEGDTVSLQCTYGEELKMNKKYWCKEAGLLISRCSGTIFSGEYGQDGRVSVHDSPQELKFKVTLRNLTLKDTGKYWCGVQRVGFDKSFLVSLSVFPVTTAKQGKTGTKASPFPGTSLYKHTAASPDLFSSNNLSVCKDLSSPNNLSVCRDLFSPNNLSVCKDLCSPSKLSSCRDLPPSYPAGLHLSRGSQFCPQQQQLRAQVSPRVSIPMIRILAPVLVLLALLLATGLAALGSYVLRQRREAQQDTKTQKKEKIHLSHQPLGSIWASKSSVINCAGLTGPPASPEPSASPNTEIRCLSQTSEKDGASLQDPEGAMSPGPPLPKSGEELDFSKIISV